MKTLYPSGFTAAVISLLIISAGISAQDINSSSARDNVNCSYSWITQNSGTTSLLYSVKTVSELTGWTAGTGGVVRRTTDGGNTWLNGNPNPGIINGNILSIEAIDENTAWVTTSPSVNTFIYKTTNGGLNWAQVYSSVGGFINGIHMISPLNGYALGDPVSNIWQILTTSDGGSSWHLLPSSPAALIAEQGFENCTQVSLPFIWFGASFGSVYRSTNNGLNWTSHVTPGINIYVLAVHFNSITTGLASSVNMVKSTDGGSTYISQPVPGAGNINSIDGIGENYWITRGTVIYRTTNNGDNWIAVYTASSTQLSLDLKENTTSGCLTGWSVGYGGTVAKLTGSLVGTGNISSNLPDKFLLEQNYPNPFNPVTNIKFSIPKSEFVKLKVLNVLGEEVSYPVNGQLTAGFYNVDFDASNLSSGVYFCRIEAGSFIQTRKMLLVK